MRIQKTAHENVHILSFVQVMPNLHQRGTGEKMTALMIRYLQDNPS